MIRPTGDLGLYLAGADERPSYERTRAWLRDNDGFRRDILKRLRKSGPLSSRELPDTAAVPWASSGWTHNRNVTQMLEILMNRGEVAISGRVGRERLWDLPERVYPAGVAVPSVEEAERAKDERRLGALGIARAKARAMPMEPIHVGEAGEPAVVEGVKGEWRVDPARLGRGLRGPHRAALALRPPDPRPDAHRGAVRLRVHARDVQAGRQAPLGLLRAPDPPRRPPGRKARRRPPTARPRSCA